MFSRSGGGCSRKWDGPRGVALGISLTKLGFHSLYVSWEEVALKTCVERTCIENVNLSLTSQVGKK